MMPVFAAVDLVLVLDVVADEEGAEMALEGVDFYFFHIFLIIIKDLSVDLFRFGSHFDHFADSSCAVGNATGQVRICVSNFPLYLSNF